MFNRIVLVIGLFLVLDVMAASAQDRNMAKPTNEARVQLARQGFKVAVDEYMASQADLAMVPVWSRRILAAEMDFSDLKPKPVEDHLDRLKQFLRLVQETAKRKPEGIRQGLILNLEYEILDAETLLVGMKAN